MSELTTDRLVLRGWTTDEITAARDGARREDWATDFPADGDRVIAGLLADNPDWLGEHGHRLIVERSTGLVVGSIGLFPPPSDGAVEIGYGVVASRRGIGYASEATLALTGFALTAPDVTTVCARVDPSNAGSVRVLEKAGFRLRGTDGDEAVYDCVPVRTAS